MPPGEPADRFEGTVPYYARHRPGYDEAAIRYLRDRFDLDGAARVLDLGCGTGELAVPLAEHVDRVVGMDPNEDMLRAAGRRAEAAGRENVAWVVGSDADLGDGLGTFRLTTMGRSFHWMDRAATLDRLYDLTEPGGGAAILTDTEWLVRGSEDWQADVHAVADEYLDDFPPRTGPVEAYDDPWDELLVAAGFADVEVRALEFDRRWNVDSVVGYVFSLSFCSPDRFGDDRDAFERDVRARLADRGGGPFEQTAELRIVSGRR